MADPTKKKKEFSEADFGQLERYGAIGMNYEQIGYCFDLGKSTFDRYMKDDPRIVEAIKKGKSQGIAQIGSNVFNLARGVAKHDENGKFVKWITPPDKTMMIFFLKCHAGWHEGSKVFVEHSGAIEQKDAQALSQEERDREIKEIADRLGLEIKEKS